MNMAKADIERTRINNKWPIAREGIPFSLIGLIITLILLYFRLFIPGIVFGVLTLFTLYFFRDPERSCKIDDSAILAPADGRILDVLKLNNDVSPLGEETIKISIFMSIFSVHVNRIPVRGKILDISYNKGKFFSANLDKASEQNENNRITLEMRDGRKLLFIQIAGLIARRIVCWINEQEHVKAGQRCGIIRFGSRLDIFLPSDTKVAVKPKNMVKAGETILGYLS